MVYQYVFNATAWDRFWPKLRQDGDCWIWTRGTSRDGYGQFTCGYKPDGRQSKGYAHVIAYLWLRGEISPGLELDHLCRRRLCCNPWHMDQVPRRINLLRGRTLPAINAAKTHCPAGHPYDIENTAFRPNGKRRCLTCAMWQKTTAKYKAQQRAHQQARYVPHPRVYVPKTHCPQGHLYDEMNTVTSGGKRRCRMCLNERSRAYYYARKKAVA